MKRGLGGGLIGLLLISAVLNVLGGPHWYSVTALWQPPTELISNIIWGMRVPRMLASVMVGALLAVSGLLLQTIAHNPIADPSILGINAGANLALIIGGVIGIGMSIGNTIWLSLIGAGVAFTVVLGLSLSHHGIEPLRLILGGTVFSGFISCLSYAVSVVTNTSEQYRNLLVGGFSSVTYGQIWLLAGALVIVIISVVTCSTGFTLLALDEQTTQGLGVATGRLWLIAAGLIIIATGVSVSVGGNIGFVGLGIPQLINVLRPGSFKQNVGSTMLAGAIFMTLADLIAKTAMPSVELPLAALSAMCGGCLLFIMVLLGRQVVRE